MGYRSGRDPRRRNWGKDWNWIDPFSSMQSVASSIRNPEGTLRVNDSNPASRRAMNRRRSQKPCNVERNWRERKRNTHREREGEENNNYGAMRFSSFFFFSSSIFCFLGKRRRLRMMTWTAELGFITLLKEKLRTHCDCPLHLTFAVS